MESALPNSTEKVEPSAPSGALANPSGPYGGTFDHVASLVKKLIGAPISFYYVPGAATEHVVVKSEHGGESTKIVSVPAELSLGQTVLRNGGPWKLEEADIECLAKYSRETSVTVGSALGVPIKSGQRFLGAFGVAHPTSKNWSDEELELVQNLAALAGPAIELSREIERRRLVEIALQENVGIFNAIAEGTTDTLFVKDLDGRYRFINRAGANSMGKSVQEVVGQSDQMLFPSAISSRLMEADRMVIQEGATRTMEEDTEVNGRRHTFLTTKGVFRDRTGKITGVFGIGRDITSRKIEEESTRMERDLLAGIIRTSIAAICILDPSGRILFVNESAERILGVRKDEVEGSTYNSPLWKHTALDGGPLTDDVEPFRRILDSGQPVFDARIGIHWPDGSKHFISVNGAPIKGVDGELTSIVFQITDITESLRAQEALRNSEEKFSKAFRANPDAFAISELETARYVEVNPGLERLFGYTRKELIGCSSVELGIWPRPEERRKFTEALAEKGSVVEYEATQRGKTGKEVVCLISAELIEIGGIVHVVSNARDISNQKRAEKEKELLEAELRQSQKMEAIGTLAGGIAHDFNNILTGIFGHAELAKLTLSPSAPAHDHIHEILRAGERAKDLVSQILAFSRRQEQVRKPLLLATVVSDAVNFLRATLPASIEIRSQLTNLTPVVLLDPGQIHQVIMNLGTNAAHAMNHHGALTIDLDIVRPDEIHPERTYPSLTRGHCALVRVTDTGEGIDPSILERIFEPFFTTKPLGVGTGLGLSVAHGIMQSHGGAIFVSSEQGKGTTFELVFPLFDGTLSDPAQATEPETVTHGRGQRVMLVDDEDTIVRLGASLLTRIGYRVTTFTRPSEALAAFRKEPMHYDLVISDYTMPDTAGDELTKQIISIRPDIPVIIISGFAPNLNQETVRAFGARTFLAKPFTFESLGFLVHQQISIAENQADQKLSGGSK